MDRIDGNEIDIQKKAEAEMRREQLARVHEQRRTRRLVRIGAFLLPFALWGAIEGVAWAAGAIRAAYWLSQTQQASAPTGTGITSKDRVWFKSGNGHIVHSDTSNVDHDLDIWGTRRAIADTAATITTADFMVSYTSITATRIATLPNAATTPAGTQFIVGDESGSVTPAIKINVQSTGGTVDTIAAGTGVNLIVPRCFSQFETDGTNWHTIGGLNCLAPTWTNCTYANSWVDFGAPYYGCQYYKDSSGNVHIHGVQATGSAGTATITTLPVGFRPTKTVLQPANSNNLASVFVTVTSAGVVACQAGANVCSTVSVVIPEMQFSAEQ